MLFGVYNEVNKGYSMILLFIAWDAFLLYLVKMSHTSWS